MSRGPEIRGRSKRRKGDLFILWGNPHRLEKITTSIERRRLWGQQNRAMIEKGGKELLRGKTKKNFSQKSVFQKDQTS